VPVLNLLNSKPFDARFSESLREGARPFGPLTVTEFPTKQLPPRKVPEARTTALQA